MFLKLSLALFVLWILADDINSSFSPDDFTIFTNFFNWWTNFHVSLRETTDLRWFI